MRQHTARQRGEGGGWHYVSLSSRGGYPLGYCADHEPHATEAEARECYAQYQRDHIVLDAWKHNWCGCEVDGCGNPTKSSAKIEGDAYRMAALCPEHMSIEHAVKALGIDGPAGDAWIS